jgi:glycerophosphoryl diester phosphodiesterase
MKIHTLIFILISNFIFIKSDGEYENTGYPDNINIESISYELTYNNYSVVKVTIKTYDELERDISFIAYLKSHVEGKTYKLNCSTKFYDIIDCYSNKNEIFNLNDKYFFYYNKTNSKITFDERDVLEDDKQISLIFKPEISVDDKLYRDNRKIIAEIDGKMVGGGFLYITKKTKHVLNKPKDGFNKYIDLKNFIAQVGLQSDLQPGTLSGYKEAIKRGYHIVEAVLRFSADKVPVICHEDELEKVSDGTGKISKTKIRELLKLDFGSKFGKKHSKETILTLEILLQFCKELNIIIDLDLSHLDSQIYFENNMNYTNILINLIEKYDMINSVFFSDNVNSTNLLRLMSKKKDIVISVSNINKKEDLDKVKTQFSGAKRIIINPTFSIVDEEFVMKAKLLGYKIKVNSVSDISYAKKITNWGVDFVKTQIHEPFLIENEKEDPIIVRCIPIDDDHSECEIDDDVYLKDNEYYNIYYSENIYNISSDINSEPIAEFQYVETNILDELYYIVDKFDFINGILKLNLSEILKKGEEINGVVAPDYENVAEIYQLNFICVGIGNFTVDCNIHKDEEDKLLFNGKYSIYYLEDYSFNEYETEQRANFHEDENIVEYMYEQKFPYLLTFCIIIFVIIVILIIYCVKCRNQSSNNYDWIRIADNNYLSDNYLFR